MARDVPLRSVDEPWGLSDLRGFEEELAELGTKLARWSVKFAHCLHQVGGYVSIENPVWSFLWFLPEIRSLWETPGWGAVVFPQQQFGTE